MFDYNEIVKFLNVYFLIWKKSWWKKFFLEWLNVGIGIVNGDGSFKVIDLFVRIFIWLEKLYFCKLFCVMIGKFIIFLSNFLGKK